MSAPRTDASTPGCHQTQLGRAAAILDCGLCLIKSIARDILNYLVHPPSSSNAHIASSTTAYDNTG